MSYHGKPHQKKKYPRKWQLPLLEEQWPWEEVFTTDETFRGRYFFLSRINEEEPTYGLPGLAHILPIASKGPHRSPLLVPAEKGLLQFGLLGVSPKTDLQRENPSMTMETMLSARWLFAVEWVKDMSAWDALLFTFDHLDPLFICLKPALVFPTLFVARMAEHPQTSVFQTVTTWAPLLDEIQERLLPLILALFLHWIDGPSLAAQELRACEEMQDQPSEEQTALIEKERATFQEELDALEHLIGSPRLHALLHAERLVPAVLRLLDEVSCSLWNSALPIREQQASVLKTHPNLQALLPIALWQSEAFHPLNRSLHQCLSLESLSTIWQSRNTTAGEHEEVP